MSYRSDKIHIWEWLLLLVCLFVTHEQISLLFPFVKDVVVLIAGCLILAVSARKFFNRKEFLFLLLYSIVLFINLLSGDKYFSNIGMVVEEIAILFFTAAISFYAYTNNREKFSVILVVIIFAVIVYYSIFTFIINIEYPGIVRQAVIMANEQDKELTSLYLKGLVNYQFPHALPIVIPAIIANLRNKENSAKVKILYYIVLAGALSMVFISYSATALFLTFLALILSLIVRNDSLKNNLARMGVVMIIALLFLISSDLILPPLIQLFTTSDNAIYLERLLDIQNLTKSGSYTGDLASRQEVYNMTFSVLSGNVFFGTDNMPGGHMVIIDRLACLGLVGWVPFILFIYNHITFSVKQINKKNHVYYGIGVFVGLLMLSIKGVNGWEMWLLLFTVLPLMLNFPRKNQISSNS